MWKSVKARSRSFAHEVFSLNAHVAFAQNGCSLFRFFFFFFFRHVVKLLRLFETAVLFPSDCYIYALSVSRRRVQAYSIRRMPAALTAFPTPRNWRQLPLTLYLRLCHAHFHRSLSR